jgi:hypothetical protein
VSSALVVGACSRAETCANGGNDAAGTPADPTRAGSTTADGAIDQTPDGGALDGSAPDADAATDGATPADGAAPDAGLIEVQKIGRFTASDGVGERFAFPGSRLVARFTGATEAVIKLTQTDGFSGGPSWFNVVVDGTSKAPFSVAAGTSSITVAQGLDPATAHTVEVEKRTEANLGVVRFEGFTFPNGGALIAPPARPTRRIEFLSESTIDGFGVEGSRLPGGTCAGGQAPPEYNNARKSTAALTAASFGAEYFLTSYSGKGLTKNASAADALLYPTLYPRTLPDDPATTWSFASWVPDAVVISLGGVDLNEQSTQPPPGFTAAYGALLDTVRANYPQAYVFLTIWSQIKDYASAPNDVVTRTVMKTALQGILDGRGDAKMSMYVFTQANVDTDETGCQYHANEAHHAAMAAELVSAMKTKIAGW